MNTNKQLVQNTIIIFLGKVFTQLLSFLLLPLYTSFLTTEEYGVTDVIFTIGSLLAPVLILQLDAGLFRVLIDNRENAVQIKRITKSVFFVSGGLVLTLVFVFSLVSHFYRPQYSEYLLGYIIATIFLNLILQYFRGIGKNIVYSILCCVNGVIIIILNIIFIVVFQLGVRGMLFAYIIGESIVALVGLSIIYIRGKDILVKSDISAVKPILLYSIPLIFNGVSWWVMNLSDRLIISGFLSYSYNGIYAVSNKFSSVFFSAYSIFNLSWTEVVSSKQTGTSFSKEILKINNEICEGLLSISALIIASMYIVFPLLVNESYKDGYNYVPILIIAVYFNCLGAQLGGLMVSIKDSKSIAKTSLVGAAINLVINIIFIKFIGLYAASVSTLLAYFVMFILRYKKMGKEIMRFSINDYGLPLLAVVTSLVCYYFSNAIWSTLNLLCVAIFTVYRYKKYVVNIFSRIRKR